MTRQVAQLRQQLSDVQAALTSQQEVGDFERKFQMALTELARAELAQVGSKKDGADLPSACRHCRRAEELLRAALQGNVRSVPYRAAALHNLAHALHGLQQPMEAIQHCCAAAALDPKAAAGPVHLRADIWARIGDPGNALEDLQWLLAEGQAVSQDKLDALRAKAAKLDFRLILQLPHGVTKQEAATACRHMKAAHSPDKVQEPRLKQERTLRHQAISAAQALLSAQEDC